MKGPKVSQLDVVNARIIVGITENAAKSGNAAAYISTILDVLRDDMDPITDSPLCIGLMAHAERKGLLGQ